MKIKLALIAIAAGGAPFATAHAVSWLDDPAPSAPVHSSETRKFRDWTAVCDNINNCIAYAPAAGDAGYVLVKRDAGPEAKPRVYADSQIVRSSGVSLDLVVDGRSFSGEQVQEGDDAPAMAFQQDTARLAGAIGNARSISLTSNGEAAPVSATGSAAALLWIDERQGRLGTTTALIRKGSRPASTVPAAPAAPARVVAAPFSQTDLPKTMPASVFAHAKLTLCNADNRVAVTVDSGWSVYRLAADTLLWTFPCGYGAYNTFEGYVISSNDGSNVQLVDFPSSRGARDTLVNSDFDVRTNTISAFSKSRGPGDCGQNASWAWNGNSFALVEENTMDDCLGIHPDLWPSLWRTQG